MRSVPVLLTCDIHTHQTGSAPVRQDLLAARPILQELGAPCTFFFTAVSAEQLQDQVEALRQDGHEIGCHGLTHAPSENYNALPAQTQRRFLTEATARLTKILDEPPRSFRAPVFKVSGDTIRALEELGYQADVSVTAQRLGVFGSNIYDMKPFFAPRRPYHPALQNPFSRGTTALWEIPVSAWLLPFLSNTERLCGLPLMRLFFRALYLESRATGKPIVFIFHAEDLNAARGIQEPRRLSWRDFLPTRTYGFQFRDALLERDWRRVQRDLVALFRYMAGFPGVQFLTVQEYVATLNGTSSTDAPASSHAAKAEPPIEVGHVPAPQAAGVGAPAAMLSGKDILCVSSIDWDFIWQGHQEIMATFAREGNRVLFVENTGVRAPRLRDLPRLKRRFMNWVRSTKGFRTERENLFVYSPLILPFPYSRIARWINRGLLLRAIQRWMRATGFHRPILWTFLPTPLTLDLIQELDPELTIYYCIDDFASSSSAAKRITRSETQIFRTSDLIFVTSEKLRQRAARFSERVHFFPFGVDFEKFEEVRTRADDIPEDLRALARPVVGYVGGLHRWIDQGVVAEIARRMPETTFALIGPAQTDLSRLRRCPNVRLLGARAHEDLPRYVKGFDVGIVPYHLSDYTAHVYPTKLNEYLAMGMPVVATALPEIERFNARHGNVVATARNADEFADAIRDAIAGNSPELVRRRIEVSRQNGWRTRIAEMSTLIQQTLEIRQLGRERWQESFRRLYRVARRRIVRLTLGVGLTYLLIFQSPLIWLIAEPLRVTAPPSHTEAIVVFAGGVGESGKAGGGYQERVKQAVDLYHEGKAPHIILSSGYTLVFQEAEVMRELAVAHGVPASAIILEQRASNTRENVAFVADILNAHGWESVLLVSSPYHMRRALLTWDKAAPHIRVVPSPMPESRFYAHQRGAHVKQIRGILHEYLGILYYWWRGWI